MKQEREHQEIHLDVVAEGRELNKNQKKKNWLFKIYALFELSSYFFFFVWDYQILYSVF